MLKTPGNGSIPHGASTLSRAQAMPEEEEQLLSERQLATHLNLSPADHPAVEG
jgi:hypothetical protein